MKTQSMKASAAEMPAADPAQPDAMEQRLAQRLIAMRTERGWTLDELAKQSGISRATLSRFENCETSPTANNLAKLCAVYGIGMSQMLADIDDQPASLLPSADQPVWVDPESGFTRRMVSPAARGFKQVVTEITLPAKAEVSYDTSPVQGTEVHLWMLQGAMELTRAGTTYHLKSGDCLRFHMSGGAHIANRESKPARYAVFSGVP